MLTLGKLQNASQHPQSGVYHQEYYRYVILDAMQKDMGDSRHQPQGRAREHTLQSSET